MADGLVSLWLRECTLRVGWCAMGTQKVAVRARDRQPVRVLMTLRTLLVRDASATHLQTTRKPLARVIRHGVAHPFGICRRWCVTSGA